MPTITTFLSFGGDLGTCGMTKFASSCDQSLAQWSHVSQRQTSPAEKEPTYCGWIASISPTM